MLGFAKVGQKLVSKKNSLFPFINIGKIMEEIIEKKVTEEN